MEPTVSGNEIPVVTEPLEPGNEIPIEKEPFESVEPFEPVINNYAYEADNSAVCTLLEGLLSEAVKNNDVLERLADSLDAVRETLAAEPEETAEDDAVPAGADETEGSLEELTEMLEGIEETFYALKETGKNINETVSGNTLYLEDISGTMQAFTESYTEVSETRAFADTYGLALGICILFVSACIAGLHIAKMVWGKTR